MVFGQGPNMFFIVALVDTMADLNFIRHKNFREVVIFDPS
jgi:hypothetical protein